MYILSAIVKSAERFLKALTKSLELEKPKKLQNPVIADESEDELGFSCHESRTSKSLVNNYRDDPIESGDISIAGNEGYFYDN